MKEMVGACCVCSDERGWTENPLVYCDGPGCSVAVHQACYGIVSVPEGQWHCEKCRAQSKNVKCELCPMREGALKPTDTQGWAHVVCALYIPEVRFGNVATMDPIILLQIPHERFNRICYICEKKGEPSSAKSGACMQCNRPSCKQYFHVTCAQQEGFLCEESGHCGNIIKYCGYCDHHFKKLKKDPDAIKVIPPYRPRSFLNSFSISEKQSQLQNSSRTSTPSPNARLLNQQQQSSAVNTNGRHSRPSSNQNVSSSTAMFAPYHHSPLLNPKSEFPSIIAPPVSGSTVLPGSNSTPPLLLSGSNTNAGVTSAQQYHHNRNSSISDTSATQHNGPASRSSSSSSLTTAAGTRLSPSVSNNSINSASVMTSSSSMTLPVCCAVAGAGVPTNTPSISGINTQGFISSHHYPLHITSVVNTNYVNSVSTVSSIGTNNSLLLNDMMVPSTSYASTTFKVNPATTTTIPSQQQYSSNAAIPFPAEAPKPVAPVVKPRAGPGRPRLSETGGTSKRRSSSSSSIHGAKPGHSGGGGGTSGTASKKPRKNNKQTVKSLLEQVSPVIADTVTSFHTERLDDQRVTALGVPSSYGSGGITNANPMSGGVYIPTVPPTSAVQHLDTAALVALQQQHQKAALNNLQLLNNAAVAAAAASNNNSSSSALSVGIPGGGGGSIAPPPPHHHHHHQTHTGTVVSDLRVQYPDGVGALSSSALSGLQNPGVSLPSALSLTGACVGVGHDASTSSWIPTLPPHPNNKQPVTTTSTTTVSQQQHSNNNNNNGSSAFPTSLDQLLERQWEQGSAFLMDQAQHFDIASLLSCLNQLKEENQRLDKQVSTLAGRRDHLLAVNARLCIPLAGSSITPGSNASQTTLSPSQQTSPRIQNVSSGTINLPTPHPISATVQSDAVLSELTSRAVAAAAATPITTTPHIASSKSFQLSGINNNNSQQSGFQPVSSSTSSAVSTSGGGSGGGSYLNAIKKISNQSAAASVVGNHEPARGVSSSSSPVVASSSSVSNSGFVVPSVPPRTPPTSVNEIAARSQAANSLAALSHITALNAAAASEQQQHQFMFQLLQQQQAYAAMQAVAVNNQSQTAVGANYTNAAFAAALQQAASNNVNSANVQAVLQEAVASRK